MDSRNSSQHIANLGVGVTGKPGIAAQPSDTARLHGTDHDIPPPAPLFFDERGDNHGIVLVLHEADDLETGG